MKNLIKTFFIVIVNFNLISCSKEEIKEDLGVPTELKGKVADNIRGINIYGYKIVLVKSWSSCNNWACGLVSQEIGTAFTDINGNYSIKFNNSLRNSSFLSLLFCVASLFSHSFSY